METDGDMAGRRMARTTSIRTGVVEGGESVGVSPTGEKTWVRRSVDYLSVGLLVVWTVGVVLPSASGLLVTVLGFGVLWTMPFVVVRVVVRVLETVEGSAHEGATAGRARVLTSVRRRTLRR